MSMTSPSGDGIIETSPDQGDDAEELRSRLASIEERPVGERADDYAQVHAQLQALLEGSDVGDTRG